MGLSKQDVGWIDAIRAAGPGPREPGGAPGLQRGEEALGPAVAPFVPQSSLKLHGSSPEGTHSTSIYSHAGSPHGTRSEERVSC